MEIIVLSKVDFEREVIQTNFIDITKEKIFYLSILTPDDLDSKPFREDSSDYKTMWFYDIEESRTEEDGRIIEPITEEQIDDIYKYIISHSDYDKFIVHCTMGMSRSGAVGAFANDLFGNGYEPFKRRNPQITPNSLISRKLRRYLY